MPKKSPPKKQLPATVPNTLDQYLESYSTHMVKEVFRFLQTRREQNGELFADKLTEAFVTSFLTAVIFGKLKDAADSTGDQNEKFNAVFTKFAGAKLDLQDAVAKGFSNALSAFSGRRIDYFCSVQPVPEDKSELSN